MPRSKKYIMLLRGINVGGKNIIKMADLKACLEKHGLEDVRTYIQSGNVIFRADSNEQTLTEEIQRVLSKQFGYTATVAVLAERQLRAVIKKAPKGFGQRPDEYYSDVLFLMPPLTAKEVLPQLKLRDGVDQAWAGDGVLYFARLGRLRTKSKLSEITKLPVYKQLSIRSWNTTTKLLALMDEGTD
jgi:uncharacterized protein (DUF1697 family)